MGSGGERRERQEGVAETTLVGRRLREVRCWRQLTLREAAGLAGLSFSFWAQVERGEKTVTNRKTLEAMASALRVHPVELTGQPWTRQDPASAEAHTHGLAMEIALERYELGTDPGLPVRAWPEIAADVEHLKTLWRWNADYTAMAELTPTLLAELHGAHVRMPERRREILLGLILAYHSAMVITKRFGDRGLPILAARAVQQCAEALDDPAWLGYAAWVRGGATGHLDRDAQYRRLVAAAQSLSSQLNHSEVLQACGMLHLSAALAAGTQADHDTVTTHLEEASALAARMDTEVGTWAHLWFGPTNVGIWRTSVALELGEHGQAVQAAKAVHPELLPGTLRQAQFWTEFGRALSAEKKTRDEGVRVLLHAEQLAPQWVRNHVFVREVVANLLRRSRRDAGGRELRGLAWRMGVAPVG